MTKLGGFNEKNWNFWKFWNKKIRCESFAKWFQHLKALGSGYISGHIERSSSSPWLKKFRSKLAEPRFKILNRLEKICLQMPPILRNAQSLEKGLYLSKQYLNSWRVTENKQKFEKFEFFLLFHMQRIMKDRCWHFLGSIQMSEFSTFFSIFALSKTRYEFRLIFQAYSRPCWTCWYNFRKNLSRKILDQNHWISPTLESRA